MIFRKAFQFSLRPTAKQRKLLQTQLDECRWLYNHFLEQRKSTYEKSGNSLSKNDQNNALPSIKDTRPSLLDVHSQVLQNVVDRLDKSFQAFFRRCKAGETPGFPRFRGMHRYNSFCYPQSGFSIENGELKLSKIGRIRIKMHRPISGTIKTCTLRRNASGDWTVSLSCAVEAVPKPPQEESVGIDVGLTDFATLSNREKIKNPRFFRRGEKKLAKAQRGFAKTEKGTKERRKKGKAIAKIHSKISNQRKDFCHKESKKIIDRYQYICIEDLNIKKMIERSSFAKSILDASWNQFRQCLTYKAEEAGRKIGLVDPAYTTQDCSRCYYRERKALWERKHCCPNCGYCTTRDHNSSETIETRGMAGLGVRPRSPRL